MTGSPKPDQDRGPAGRTSPLPGGTWKFLPSPSAAAVPGSCRRGSRCSVRESRPCRCICHRAPGPRCTAASPLPGSGRGSGIEWVRDQDPMVGVAHLGLAGRESGRNPWKSQTLSAYGWDVEDHCV
jgi:hypothetical protein